MSDEKEDEKLVKFVVVEKPKEGEGEEVERTFDLPKLFQQLADENPETREKTIYTLIDCAWIHNKFDEILMKIVKCLEDENEKVRGSAAYAIAKYAEERVTSLWALAKLLELLEDKSEQVVKRAADTITKLYDTNFHLFWVTGTLLRAILRERLPIIIEKSKAYLPENVVNSLLRVELEGAACKRSDNREERREHC
ncbi:MAG: sister chromatid cohesion protein PDS5 [Candidatus Freyarchaeota archaeon]